MEELSAPPANDSLCAWPSAGAFPVHADAMPSQVALLDLAASDDAVVDFSAHDGLQILESVGQAPRFNAWLMSQLAPFLGRRILEAGSGIGNLTAMLGDRDRVVGVDMETVYVDRLRRRYAESPQFAFHQADLQELAACRPLADENLDTILCVNVLEHVPDDRRALQQFYQILQPGGVAILLVPAHQWLYSHVDRTLGHHRRYTEWDLASKMASAGFQIDHTGWFNRLGMLGWMASGKLLRRRTLSSGQMRLYERLMPIAQQVEKLRLLPALSLIAVGRK